MNNRFLRAMITAAFAALILLAAMPAIAVQGEGIPPELPAPPPEYADLLGGLEPSPSTWNPFVAGDHSSYSLQSFRYPKTGGIGLAIGAPIHLGNTAASIEDATLQFTRENAGELGMFGCDQVVESVGVTGGLTVVLARPHIANVPVYGGFAVMVFNNAGDLAQVKAQGFGSDTKGRFAITGAAAANLAVKSLDVAIDLEVTGAVRVWLPRSSVAGRPPELHASYMIDFTTDESIFQPTLFVDALSGEVIAAENRVNFERIEVHTEGFYKPLYAADQSARAVFPYELVRVDGAGTAYTNRDGDGVLEVNPGAAPYDLSSELRGRWVDVDYEDGADARFDARLGQAANVEILWDENNSRDDERTLYYHTNFIHDFWKDLDPDFDALDYPMPAVCQVGAGFDNAFWNGRGMFFGGGNEMGNFALFADIIYHEYGHGVTGNIYPHNILPYTGQSGALNEAWSDYFPCSITDEPLMGEGGLRPGGYIRNLDNDSFFSGVLIGEVHADSRFPGGAMWHSREVLGRERADDLFHYARYLLGNNFLAYFADVLLTDDDDGDISNGTPHDIELYRQFGRHGIGPGLEPVIVMTDARLFDDGEDGADGDGDGLWEAGESIRLEVELYRDGALYPPPARDIRMAIDIDHPAVSIERGEAAFGDLRVGERAISDAPFVLRIGDGARVSFAALTFRMTVDGNPYPIADTLRIPIGQPPVLLVRDGGDAGDHTIWFERTLIEIGVVHHKFAAAAPIRPLGEFLTQFPTVIWFTGNADRDILSRASRAILADHLESGGSLLLTGQDAGSTAGSEGFFRDYLGAVNTIDSLDGVNVYLEGVQDDPVGRGLRLLLHAQPGARNQTSPGAVAAVNGGTEIYRWALHDGEPAAGIRREDPVTGARTIYLSFGMESVGGREHRGHINSRAQALNAALTWLGVETPVREAENPLHAFALGAAYPNPFNRSVQLPFQLPWPGEVGWTVFEMNGRMVSSESQSLPGGRQVWSWNAGLLPAGAYLIRLNAAGRSHYTRVLLVK